MVLHFLKNKSFLFQNIFYSGICIAALPLFTSCEQSIAKEGENVELENLEDLAHNVDPFIGTAKMGHTYPGATVPFGSV